MLGLSPLTLSPHFEQSGHFRCKIKKKRVSVTFVGRREKKERKEGGSNGDIWLSEEGVFI